MEHCEKMRVLFCDVIHSFKCWNSWLGISHYFFHPSPSVSVCLDINHLGKKEMQIFATSSQVSRVIMLTFQESAIVSREKRKGVMKKRTCIMRKLPRNRAHFIFWAKNSKTIELDVITPQNAAAIAHHYAFLWLYTTRVPRVLIVWVCIHASLFFKDEWEWLCSIHSSNRK